MSCVTVKAPCAPDPLACMRRSGITSRAKWASFSISQMSCSSAGPRRPAVWMLRLSLTGVPVAWVRNGGLSVMERSFEGVVPRPRGWHAVSGKDRSTAPGGTADDRAEVAAMEMWFLVGDDVGFDVTESRIGLVFDAVIKSLDDSFLETFRTGMQPDDRLALTVAVSGIAEAQYVHFDTRRQQCHDRMHVRRNSRRGVQGNRGPDGVDLGLGNAVSAQEVARDIRAVDLEPLVRATVSRHQPHVVEHGAGIEQLRIELQSAMPAREGSEMKHAAGVMKQQRRNRVSNHRGDLTRQFAVGD